MGCYNCGKTGKVGIDLKQEIYVFVEEIEPNKKSICIKAKFLTDPNGQVAGFGLCQECAAIAFEAFAKKLKQMEEEDFRMGM